MEMSGELQPRYHCTGGLGAVVRRKRLARAGKLNPDSSVVLVTEEYDLL
jgi:hypothetical protein